MKNRIDTRGAPCYNETKKGGVNVRMPDDRPRRGKSGPPDGSEPSSLYEAYRRGAKLVRETEHVTEWAVNYRGAAFHILFTRRRANRLTHIECEGREIAWQQMPLCYRLNGMYYAQTVCVFRERLEPVKGEHTVVVIRGRPREIRKLDDGVFRSAHNPGGSRYIHVMSMARFRTFEPLPAAE